MTKKTLQHLIDMGYVRVKNGKVALTDYGRSVRDQLRALRDWSPK